MLRFPENWIDFQSNEWMVGDGIFTNQYDYGVLGYSHFQNGDYAARFKQIRSVVENVIGGAKEWKICKHPWRAWQGDIEQMRNYNDKAWVVCCSLYNLYAAPKRRNNDFLL